VIDALLVAQGVTEQPARGGFAHRPRLVWADDGATCKGKE